MEQTWLVQKISYDGLQVWGEITVAAENLMDARARATRVFDYRDIRSGLMVAEVVKPGVTDQEGYIIPAAKQAAVSWKRAEEEGLL